MVIILGEVEFLAAKPPRRGPPENDTRNRIAGRREAMFNLKGRTLFNTGSGGGAVPIAVDTRFEDQVHEAVRRAGTRL
jgi:hypothetical protein